MERRQLVKRQVFVSEVENVWDSNQQHLTLGSAFVSGGVERRLRCDLLD